ncbi:DUF3829 domain-containing protein [Aureibaculum sp. A20]|uniref:DUF3829 domain-containing protein n=1 Tax=Aureibaculum flavum TaxID=2795986 RepID=A0ABS0WQ10_9FLAO|nr:DUF3829 domain-containing protein [Aureibaculum flavum]MBJ2174053.1 DUF3829 domain-containing protein [Aureibaculum flavum]
MKFKIVFVLAALIVVSCGKLGDKASSALDAVSDMGSGGANSVIAYNNAMVDYMNDAGDKITKASDDYEKMSKMVTQKRKPTLFLGHAFIGRVPDINKERDDIFLLNPGNNLPSEIKEELTNSVKATGEAFANTHEAYKKFKDYYDNEDFKDDDWAKGGEYLEIIKTNITAFYEKRSEAYKILRPISDQAEIELLKDHPLKESIIASKTDLAIAEEIVDIVYAEEVDIDALNAKYDELEANHAKNKGLTPELLEEQNKATYYKNFYDEIEEYLGEVRKSKRDGKITDREAESIGRDFKSLINYYNRFV